MISSKHIQRLYVKFYKYFREYIWDYPTVETVVDLELAVFQSCPDINIILNIIDKLIVEIRRGVGVDSAVYESLQEMRDEVADSDSVYTKINKVEEVQV